MPDSVDDQLNPPWPTPRKTPYPLLYPLSRKPGAGSARHAISLLAEQLQTFLGENSALRPPPLRLCKPPVGVPSGTAEAGDSASRYFLRPKLSRDLPTTAAATPLRTGLQLENRDLRSRAPPPPPAEGATSLLLRRLRGRLLKRTSPDGH